MGSHETLRLVIDAGRTSKRLDELSTARVIGKVAALVHGAQQAAGAHKAVGPITPAAIAIDSSGALALQLDDRGNALAYSSPEVIEGAAGDRRSDVFSLGIIMWEALTCQRLFDALNDAAVRVAVRERTIKTPLDVNANIPAELSAICMKALSRTSGERYQSVKVMGVEIEEFLDEAGFTDNDDKLVAFLANLPAKPPATTVLGIPAAPAEPRPSDAAIKPPAVTVLGVPAAPASPGREPRTSNPYPPPQAGAPVLPSIHAVGAYAPPPAPEARLTPMPPIVPAAPVRASSHPRAPTPAPLPRASTPPPVPPESESNGEHANGTGTVPQAAITVALPASRESRDVLASWAWQTDSHTAITDDEDGFEAHGSSRKPLLYVIGAGLGLAAIVTIIAVAFSSDDKPKQAIATPPRNADTAMMPPESPPPRSPPAPVPPPPTTDPAVATGSGSSEPAVATGSGSPDGVAPPDAAAESARVEPTPPPPPTKVEPTPPPPPAKVEPTPPPPAKVEPTPPPPPPAKIEPERIAKPSKKSEPKKPEPKKPETAKVAKTPPPPAKTPPPPAKTPSKLVDPFKPATPAAGKIDVVATNRAGLQQFARGDTTGALASLRTSLAADPKFPATWRGLGLVFEKMGDKDQARNAYRRYLELAPNAGDADQIRGRLERL